MSIVMKIRVRPKVILATNYEEAVYVIDHYRENLIGVISDVRYKRNGEEDEEAGIELIRYVKRTGAYIPCMLQSQEIENAVKAEELHAAFINKNSPTLAHDIQDFIKGYLGFGDFIFRNKNGEPIDRATSIEEFKQKTGLKGILCNEVGSGTEILKRFGEEHIKTGYPIVYTSADSVFQIAAHEEIIPVEKLYEICKIARKMLDNPKYNVGTVIARPFVGEKADNFVRTYNRKDFESSTFGKNMLDVIEKNNKYEVIAIGKIEDLFSGRGITKAIHTEGNADGINKTIECIKKDSKGLIFTNLVDFDMLYGHRNNIEGYGKALEYFDGKLPDIINSMKNTDMLIITADHGNDPSTKSTDHSREYVPVLVYGKNIKENVNLGTRETYADISATILDILGLEKLENGTSFKNEILQD